MTGFEAYKLFLAVQLHFTHNEYDFIKYGGTVNATPSAFEVRSDKYHFYRLSRKYTYEELKNYFLSNFSYRDIKWSGDLMTEEAEKIYKNWLKNTQSLSYIFHQDVNILCEKTLKELIRVPKNKDPELLTRYYGNGVKLETLLIMNIVLDFFPYWEKKITDNILFPPNIKRWKKYTKFLNHIDTPKFEKILKEHFLDFPAKKA